ncbi:tyrosine-type recombinase/integrase [Thalassotalea sp. Y01]|uniref:tyrosine-type recombinase/integrase n=1 Tax=Thalassotalea sp. Y01 TaxID=2729613 RepID=UPI00145E9CE8|nr:tyrosine-type recombinase/integrase [Thalassotalea sp. Y01]NMP16139.1 tyrosine-type recombinase/integrase [Thalassotalea sp. Y01]
MATNNNKPITALSAKNLKAGEYLADTHPNRGLRLVANQNGTKSWIYRYRNQLGKLKQIKLGSYPALSVSDARLLYLEQKAIRDKGGDPAELKKQDIADKQAEDKANNRQKAIKAYTISCLIEDYYRECIKVNRKQRSADQAYGYLQKHVVDVWGDIPATELTITQIREHLFQLQMVSPAIAKKVQVDLKAAFDNAIESDRIESPKGNPVRYKVKYEVNKSRYNTLSDVKLASWFKWLDDAPLSENIKDIYLLTLYTGCRSGELVGAEWNHVDFDNSTLLLPETKNGKSRYVQLSTQAMEVIKSRRGQHETYIFPSQKTGKAIQQKTLSQKLTEVRKGKRIIDGCPVLFKPHDLRRTVRTGLTKPIIGCPVQIAELIIGHSQDKLLETYDTDPHYQEQHHYLQKWCDHLDHIRNDMDFSNVITISAKK